MADFKGTIIFKAGAAGWTETVYLVHASIENAAVSMLAYCNARAGLLSAGARIDAFRLSDEAVIGDSYFSPIPPNYTSIRSFTSARDVVQTALLGRWKSGTRYGRQVWISGIPDGHTTYNTTLEDFTISDTLYEAFNFLRSVVIAGPFAIKAVSKEVADIAKQNVLDVAVAGVTATITTANHGYAVGDQVRLSGLKGLNAHYLKGVFQVRGVTATTFDVRHEAPTGTSIIWQEGGTVKRRVAKFFPINDGTYLRVASRDRGRAFFVPRGRSKAKK